MDINFRDLSFADPFYFANEKALYFASPRGTCGKVTLPAKSGTHPTSMTCRKSRSITPVGIERAPVEEQGRDTRFGGRARGRREDGGSPVRLSFKLFAGETRVTRPRAKRREALTGKQRVRGVWSMDTIDEVDTEWVCRKGPAGRRRAGT